MKIEENYELPLDVFDIISRALDFNDLFQFTGVCKNWRTFYKIYRRNFLASHEPLLLQISYHVKKAYSFISIPNQKVYHLEMMKYFLRPRYVTSSSGYFIMRDYNNFFLLINPCTRIKKVIITPNSEFNSFLAFVPCLLLTGAPKNLSWRFYAIVVCMSINLEIVVGLLIQQ